MRRVGEAKTPRRVYEYVDQDGVRYFSFTKHEVTTPPPVRLRLQKQGGMHWINFIAKLRREVDAGAEG